MRKSQEDFPILEEARKVASYISSIEGWQEDPEGTNQIHNPALMLRQKIRPLPFPRFSKTLVTFLNKCFHNEMYPYIFFISQTTCVLFLRSGTKLSANSRSLRAGVKKGLLHKNIYVYISVFGYNLIFICQFISTFPVIILRFFTKPFLFYRMYLHKSIISIKKRNKKKTTSYTYRSATSLRKYV